MKYDIKEPPKLKNGILEDHIDKELAKMIGKLDPKEINSLYRAVHYLKIYALRKCIAAVMACRVHIEPTLENYNKKKAEIGLKEELTTEKSKEYKERFPFMNWPDDWSNIYSKIFPLWKNWVQERYVEFN